MKPQSPTPVIQRYLLLSFIAAAVWIGIGRGFLGAGGWGFLLTMFIYAPLILVYGATVSAIVATRRHSSGYGMDKLTQRVAIALFAGLGVFGLTMVDGGDTAESLGSALSKLLGNGEAVQTASGYLAAVSFYGSIVAAIALLVLVLLPRSQSVEPQHERRQVR